MDGFLRYPNRQLNTQPGEEQHLLFACWDQSDGIRLGAKPWKI
jgi:hypothetical protein